MGDKESVLHKQQLEIQPGTLVPLKMTLNPVLSDAADMGLRQASPGSAEAPLLAG